MKYIVLFIFMFFFLIVYSSCVAAGRVSIKEESKEFKN